MHSSRMRTVRSSGRLSGGMSALRGVGGLVVGVSAPGGCLLPGGYLLRGGCLLLGGVCFRGVSALGGVSAPGGVCSWGEGCLLPGGLSAPTGCLLPQKASQHAVRQTPPPPCGQTHACKNITFATSLRTVNISCI